MLCYMQLQLKTNLGNIHRVIPVRATLVDKASPEARAPAFITTFQYEKKSLSDILMEKYVRLQSEQNAAIVDQL